MPLELVRNDITKMRVDAIVNAANNSLLGGGGVDGAIHRAAGPRLLEACRALKGCETGQAKLTEGYDLPCRYVIHTVGPIWQGGAAGERRLLADCYRNALALAKEKGCESVAFPLISSGAYGYPKAEALRVAVEEITRFLDENDMTIYIVFFSMDAMEPSGKLFGEVATYIHDVYMDWRGDAGDEATRPRAGQSAAPNAASGLGGLFRRQHREEDARNETLFNEMPAPAEAPQAGLRDVPDGGNESFTQMLMRVIDEKGLTDAECCRRANVDRRLFDRIMNNPAYRPGKQTALAFAVALRLSMDQTRDMLTKAGYALSHGSREDIAVEYCVMTGNYNLVEINQVLFKLDLQTLGC